ncbi:hypothetical protein O3M35_006113 [Rhynocoris fuscipes]|uniref:Uncharacterized protein n=1 Tax=Rhynocoris fuscipes TaxID=488301 RepID=A0AAW1DJG1_9HEMI
MYHLSSLKPEDLLPKSPEIKRNLQHQSVRRKGIPEIAGTDNKGFVEGGGSVDRNNNCRERGSGGSSGDIGFKIK